MGHAFAPCPLMRTAALLGFVLLVVACDPGSPSAGPTASCRESGVQCRLPTGPLGVCERSPCESGEPSPCFQCTPQH
jgi:hypothetical protein